MHRDCNTTNEQLNSRKEKYHSTAVLHLSLLDCISLTDPSEEILLNCFILSFFLKFYFYITLCQYFYMVWCKWNHTIGILLCPLFLAGCSCAHISHCVLMKQLVFINPLYMQHILLLIKSEVCNIFLLKDNLIHECYDSCILEFY